MLFFTLKVRLIMQKLRTFFSASFTFQPSSSANHHSSVVRSLFFGVVFSLSAMLVFYKCKYGFGNIDESFYLVTPLRLCQGDALFTHEWHLSQTSSVLLFPLVNTYLQFTGDTTGIILSMRYICTTVQLLTSLFLYFRFKRINWLGAVLVSISFLLYTPFGIMALSYNSMGIIFLLLSLVVYSTASRHLLLQSVLSGIFLSAAVLCCPFLAILYIIFGIAVFSINFIKKHKTSSLWSLQRFICFSTGVAFSAILFLGFVFSRSSIQEIMEALPCIFNDPEHPHISFVDKAQSFFHSILTITPSAKPITGFLILLFFICAADKKRIKHSLYYIIPSILSIIVFLCDLIIKKPYINYLMWPINLLPPIIILLCNSTYIYRIFTILYLPGIIYAFCLHLSSNQQFYAISSASTISTMASILILCLFASEWTSLYSPKPLRIVSMFCLCLLFLFQISFQSTLRYQSVFWESSLNEQTEHMDDGIYKGLYISKSKKNIYANALKQMEQLSLFTKPDDQVLFLSTNTWYYLMEDYRVAAFSGWLSGINEVTLDRLEDYYSLNPDKIPDVVFADPEHSSIAQEFSNRFHYPMHQIENGIILTKPSL